MQIYALFMFLGIFTTFLIPETKRKTLEELAGEVEGTPNYDPSNVGAGRRVAPGVNGSDGSGDVGGIKEV